MFMNHRLPNLLSGCLRHINLPYFGKQEIPILCFQFQSVRSNRMVGYSVNNRIKKNDGKITGHDKIIGYYVRLLYSSILSGNHSVYKLYSTYIVLRRIDDTTIPLYVINLLYFVLINLYCLLFQTRFSIGGPVRGGQPWPPDHQLLHCGGRHHQPHHRHRQGNRNCGRSQDSGQ